jgi:hypothetical protein
VTASPPPSTGEAFVLEGGLDNWLEAGLSVET